ncbi:MAG: hypothetical protein K6B74_01310 [Ruminococcus sp.]|nr:hypothetical protein [Ruminococcus sp.]
MGKITKQQISSLAVSFYPAIKEYFESKKGKVEYQQYLDEKAALAKAADDDADDNDADKSNVA